MNIEQLVRISGRYYSLMRFMIEHIDLVEINIKVNQIFLVGGLGMHSIGGLVKLFMRGIGNTASNPVTLVTNQTTVTSTRANGSKAVCVVMVITNGLQQVISTMDTGLRMLWMAMAFSDGAVAFRPTTAIGNLAKWMAKAYSTILMAINYTIALGSSTNTRVSAPFTAFLRETTRKLCIIMGRRLVRKCILIMIRFKLRKLMCEKYFQF